MVTNLVYHQRLPWDAVLMDPWYATNAVLVSIERLQKGSFCPRKSNRLGDDSGASAAYHRVERLD